MQIKVVDGRSSLLKRLEGLTDKLEELNEEVAHGVADALIVGSPETIVDTGAYMDSFNATDGRSRGGGISSKGRPKRQSWETYASAALSRVHGQIESLGSSSIVISNNAPHAKNVESKYGRFLTARGSRNAIMASAIARIFKR